MSGENKCNLLTGKVVTCSIPGKDRGSWRVEIDTGRSQVYIRRPYSEDRPIPVARETLRIDLDHN